MIKKTFSFLSVALLFILFYLLSERAFESKIINSFDQTEILSASIGIFIFAINSTLATISILNSITRDGVSLRVIYWFYAFVFMTIAPLIQAYPWYWRHEFSIDNLFMLSIVILITNLSFILGYRFSCSRYKKFFREKLPTMKESEQKVRSFFIGPNRMLIFSWMAIFLSLILVSIYGFHFNSSIIRSIFGYNFTPIESMAEYFIRPFLFFGFSFCLFAFAGANYKRFIFKLSLFLLSISVFLVIGPLSGARAIIFFLYFGLFIIILRSSMIKHPVIFGSLLFAGVLAAQLQDLLRAALGGGGDEIALVGLNYFYQGHFDGFEMLGHAVGYVDQEGVVLGSQLLGVIFFFVPRSLWPSKPIGSGDFIAVEYIPTFLAGDVANYSMPLMAEALLNFGIFGVFIAFLLVGIYCGKEDTRFHSINKIEYFEKVKIYTNSAPFWMWRYGVSLGIFLFILRGDLQSAMSFLVGILLALISAWYLLHGRRNVK